MTEDEEQNQAQARINSAREEITREFRRFPELRKGYRDLLTERLIEATQALSLIEPDEPIDHAALADEVLTLLFNE